MVFGPLDSKGGNTYNAVGTLVDFRLGLLEEFAAELLYFGLGTFLVDQQRNVFGENQFLLR